MPVDVNFPGVYVEELTSAEKSVSGVSTSTVAFVDFFARGPMSDARHANPVRISGFRDFQRTFGGLQSNSEASYGILQFFNNGGETAFVVRCDDGRGLQATRRVNLRGPFNETEDETAAAKQPMDAAEKGGAPMLTIAATNPGVWGNALKAQVVSGAEFTFDLQIREYKSRNGRETVVAAEEFLGLTLQDENDARFALKIVNRDSKMVQIAYTGPVEKGTYPVGDSALRSLENGRDGNPPGQTRLTEAMRHALDSIAPWTFSILCLPITSTYAASEANKAITQALRYCQEKRAFMIVDIPESVKTAADMKRFGARYGTAEHASGAVYYPRLVMPDPLQNYRSKNVGPSGTMAGVYARTDSRRGIWKAPAGTEASLQGVEVASTMTEEQNGQLNAIGVNCLRSFPAYGNVAWGARTLAGADQLQSQWQYVNVRRLVSYIEQSLYQALKWAVFEGNDENLWREIRQQVGGFLSGLFASGAFAGQTLDEAYFVRCDSTTTTSADVGRGMVNVVVGIAPSKPAEFIILQIEQVAGLE